MKKITAFITPLMLSSIIWGEAMTPVSAQASCQATVDTIAREMRQKGTTVSTDSSSGENQLENSRRVNEVNFSFLPNQRVTQQESSVAYNILHSQVLMKSYASRIFGACGGTGYVYFWISNTGDREGFGMTDNGTLGYEMCRNSSREITNRISSIVGPGPSGYCAYVVPYF